MRGASTRSQARNLLRGAFTLPPSAVERSHLKECINQMVLESQPPPQNVNLWFTVTNSTWALQPHLPGS